MNSAMAFLLMMIGFVGGLMALLPFITPLRYYFAVTVSPGFRNTLEGHASMRRYETWVAIGVAAAVALSFLLDGRSEDAVTFLVVLVPVVVSFSSFFHERRVVSRFAQPTDTIREADLSADDRTPRWFALALVPIALPLGVAAYLRAHWAEIPLRFPAHFNAAGEADRWAEKSVRTVYGPLLVCAGMSLIGLLITLAMYHGARRGPQRTAIIKIAVAAVYMMAFVFVATALLPLIQFPPQLLMVPPVLFALLMVAWVYRLVRDPNMPADATPDASWHLGVVYYNPQDPAVFVQRRIGFGYTVNFGNRLAMFLMGGFIAMVIAMMFVMR